MDGHGSADEFPAKMVKDLEKRRLGDAELLRMTLRTLVNQKYIAHLLGTIVCHGNIS
jgi:hypothetical protein